MTTLEGQCTQSDDHPRRSMRKRKRGRPPKHISEDYETQAPTNVAFFNEESDEEDRGEEWVNDAGNDESLDPTWTEGHPSNMPSSDEEVVVTPPQQPRKNVHRVEKDSGRTLASMSTAIAHHAEGLSSPRHGPKSSLTWHFYRQCPNDRRWVVCTLCRQRLKRGINLMNLSTSSMKRHLLAKHEAQWIAHLKKHGRSRSPPAPSSAAISVSSTQPPGPRASLQREDATAPAVLPTMSTPSHESAQLPIHQSLKRKRKYPPTHPRALVLNGSISKLLAFEMLPLRLVETDSFKKMMAVAAPQYVVPSRHYFSRRSIPALHTHVVEQIRCALRNAINGKVHITTDTWTSNQRKERYISLTAYWVNLVADDPEWEDVPARVLPPRRVAGRFSVQVSSCSYSATSSSRHSETCTTNYRAARGKRQQAVLKLICLANKSHTAEELWTVIKEQIDEWLLPVNLKPGLVMCDNGRSLVAALGVAGLSHIPCMAHVLNLVVQSFLKNYPHVSDLLGKVRSVCARFRHSYPDAAGLAALQRQFGLPVHRLICDVPTSWNSTFRMLERLCEQQQAIVEFHAQQNHSVDQHHFTAKEWASIQDLCAVLSCFEYCTNMVSAEDAIISLTIPVICLLEKTLQAMIDDVVAQEEEEQEEPRPFTSMSGPSSTRCSEGDVLHQQWSGTQVSSQGTGLEEEEEDDDDDEEEEEEDDEEEPFSQQDGSQSSSRASLERGWGDMEDPDITPPTEDSLWPLGSLAHMSQYMLLCLHNDRRVARILTSAKYWVATMLDPRYKDNVPSLLPSLERDNKMCDYKRTLVDALMTAFPADAGGSAESQGRGASRQRSCGIASTTRVSMDVFWRKFLLNPAPPCATVPNIRQQRFHNMVEEYMSTHLHILTDGSAPFNFWASKLDTWPELALYALEVLACPAASVMSKHFFSATGGVITDKRVRLSTDNVGKLTLLKMNRAWIAPDLSLPLDD
ncbi:zinc finger BED domain-containing protein 4-like [Anomaloglossus baeobatrachus]|uniref:zinc finger BED domain-containing protein 4-like n=1 Tax=Anomaloglossus baeobatrachus TaxID=238106 RepID=UPI003F509D4E